MSEEPQQQPDEAAEDAADGPQPHSLADNVSKLRGDQALEHLVDLINNTTAAIPVLLSIQGETIFGHLTGYRGWFDDLATQVEAIPVTAGPDGDALPDGEKITEALGDFLRRFPGPPAEDDEDEDGPYYPPTYIHLTNAQIITPAGRVRAGLWRGRLSEVVGWTIAGNIVID
jgi:hypothetical protein